MTKFQFYKLLKEAIFSPAKKILGQPMSDGRKAALEMALSLRQHSQKPFKNTGYRMVTAFEDELQTGQHQLFRTPEGTLVSEIQTLPIGYRRSVKGGGSNRYYSSTEQDVLHEIAHAAARDMEPTEVERLHQLFDEALGLRGRLRSGNLDPFPGYPGKNALADRLLAINALPKEGRTYSPSAFSHSLGNPNEYLADYFSGRALRRIGTPSSIPEVRNLEGFLDLLWDKYRSILGPALGLGALGGAVDHD